MAKMCLLEELQGRDIKCKCSDISLTKQIRENLDVRQGRCLASNLNNEEEMQKTTTQIMKINVCYSKKRNVVEFDM